MLKLPAMAIGIVGVLQAVPATAQPSSGGAAVPPQLHPPAPAAMLLRANAVGSQIYACTANPAGGFAWTFKAPEAVLSDAGGKPVAKHFAGPTWQASDGSKVVGVAAANVPAPDGQGVPWLLLKAKSHEGAGEFADITYIQRLDTKGGLAPSGGCDATHAGQEAKVPYTAVYVLYR
jgi:hypothetical protein